MSIFKIDAETTIRRVIEIIVGLAYLAIMLILLLPVVIIGIVLDIIRKYTRFQCQKLYRSLYGILDHVERLSDKVFARLNKWATTDKEAVWKALTKKEEE